MQDIIIFQNSLLAMAETNLANGLVYFNCYPGFSIGLYDPHILDTLTLTIKTKNLDFKENVRVVVVIYRVYYKVMRTTIYVCICTYAHIYVYTYVHIYNRLK